MTEQTNTPKLRFPEFKNEWSYDLLGDVVTNKSKKFDPKKEEATKDIELDSIEQNTGRLLDTYISNDFTSQKNKFKKDNVLYSKLRPYLNKYYYATIDGVCSSEIWVLNTLNKDVLVNKFLYYFIQTNRFSSVTNKSAGSKMPRADWELVKNIRLYKGSIKEQEKIGYFFSKLDQQIELEEKKLELLEQQKKGYMQKIFSQELRFKDENGNEYPEWTSVLIKDIFNNKGGTALEKDFESDGEYKVISIGSYSMNSTYNDQNLRINKNEKTEKYILSQGDLAMVLNDKTKDGNIIGRTIFIDKDNHYIYNQRTERLIPLKENDSKFLWFFMNTDTVRNKIKSMMQGATQVYINYSSIKNISLQIPSFAEQIKIRVFLEMLLNLITEQDNKVNLLKQRKKGLLQKMFV